ncbi:CheR family methyltransferase [Montanilutibacter psychrotolerans]|nr:protein-glutamate O-methyltransferase CheR [Lysobacter psychrotolerans]
MQWDDFKLWLKQAMGLDASTVGPSVVERAVKTRMAACKRHDLAGYWHFVQESPEERQELIEAVIVPETSFFRDVEVFAALARVFDARWLAANPGRSLRLLSLPCSSGEEPYTMAIALLDAEFPANLLRIDAVDISEHSLAKARRGRYGRNSFRGGDVRFRDRHFAHVAGGWQLSDTVRGHVRFIHGNAMDSTFLPGQAIYDAIFCRNLLIYFDLETQVQVVEVLARLVRQDGLLFVGPAETGLMLNLGFVSAQMPMAFAFRKPDTRTDTPASQVPAARTATTPRTPARVDAAAAAVPRPKPATAPAPSKAATSAPPSPPAGDAALDAAQRLADGGQFAEAATACEALLKTRGPSTTVLHLLGLVHGANGQPARAEDCFRKALYLEPDHEESLMHLALLLETRGDIAGGRVLRLRAKRHSKATS